MTDLKYKNEIILYCAASEPHLCTTSMFFFIKSGSLLAQTYEKLVWVFGEEHYQNLNFSK